MDQKSGIIGWLIRKDLAMNERQAGNIVLALFIICVLLIIFILARYVFGVNFPHAVEQENAGPAILKQQRLER